MATRATSGPAPRRWLRVAVGCDALARRDAVRATRGRTSGGAWVAALAFVLLAIGTAPMATAQQAAVPASPCQQLLGADLSGLPDAPTRITAAAPVAAAGPIPGYCRVEGYVAPQVGFEFRLPLGDWNGSLLFLGCTGTCGSLAAAGQCDDVLARGYACGTTDMGHRAPGIDAKWAYNNPAAEIDFGYRATHVATLAGKAIVSRFYGQPHRRAYFRGCSTGGRQGLVAAQRFPHDFDGIIAGAPILYEKMGAPLQLVWNVTANLDADGRPVMSAAKLPVLAQAVMAACDGLDGVTDGLIDDPAQCRYDPAALRCGADAGADCLTDQELAVVRKMYAGPAPVANQAFAPFALPFGTEASWGPYFTGGRDSPSYGFAAELLRYLSFPIDPGPGYDLPQFDWARDPQRVDVSLLTAANPDLSAFARAGGKLLVFHGLGDAAATPFATTEYYRKVIRTAGGAAAASEFSRLYLPPGLAHCVGGDGINTIDFLGALEQWVEQGVAPGPLPGYRQRDVRVAAAVPVGFDPASAEYARPVYPFPDRARYAGRGDWKKAENYRRSRPARP